MLKALSFLAVAGIFGQVSAFGGGAMDKMGVATGDAAKESVQLSSGGCTSTPGWINSEQHRFTCDGYVLQGWCSYGAFVPGQEGTGGVKYNNPRENCCHCGKTQVDGLRKCLANLRVNPYTDADSKVHDDLRNTVIVEMHKIGHPVNGGTSDDQLIRWCDERQNGEQKLEECLVTAAWRDEETATALTHNDLRNTVIHQLGKEGEGNNQGKNDEELYNMCQKYMVPDENGRTPVEAVAHAKQVAIEEAQAQALKIQQEQAAAKAAEEAAAAAAEARREAEEAAAAAEAEAAAQAAAEALAASQAAREAEEAAQAAQDAAAAATAVAVEDTCAYQNDGFCDVPYYCEQGDFADCGTGPATAGAQASSAAATTSGYNVLGYGDRCASGKGLDAAGCAAAAAANGEVYYGSWSNRYRPAGCYVDSGEYTFNTNTYGSSYSYEPVCSE